MNRELQVYITPSGRKPFLEWLRDLDDTKARARVRARLDRVAIGCFGDCKQVASGVCELKLDFGPGYRIYFGEIQQRIILLLCGGDKKTQQRDIKKAQGYWAQAQGEI